jgi:putative proteasome-type protease
MRLNSGLVFLSDSRSNAGVDHISTVRKMTVFERRGDRVLILMCAGNLAVTQAVAQLLSEPSRAENLWTVPSVAKGAELVGEGIREIYRRDGSSMQQFGLDFNCSFILGGQIRGEDCRLFNIYSAGNFIEAHAESPYFQIGEFKYGKPIVDRVITPETPLDVAAKCALISMDSTLRSNISVGMPLDLLVYERDSFQVSKYATITADNHYFNSIRSFWGQELRKTFNQIANPDWESMPTNESWPVFEKQIRSQDQ